MLRRRMMLAQGGVSLPAGYTKIEYIETDGASYIDTLYKPNSNTRVKFEGYNNSTSSGWIFGAWKAVNNSMFCASALSTYNICYGTKIWANATMPVGPISIDINKNAYTYNGVSGTLSEQTFSCDYTMYLFHINAAGSVSAGCFNGRIYSVKIYDNDVLVRDFIPCTNPDGISGLWDSVNDVFYKLLPADYTRLDFIETDGTTYIDTGFKPNQDSRIKLDIQVTKSATSFLFGTRVNSSANSASNSFSMPQISGSSLRMDYGSKETSITISPLQRLDIDANKNVVTINGNVTTVPSQTFQSQYSLYLLSVNTAGALFSTQTAARIYSCQIYDNGTLVRDFIPAMNASGVAGLYDLKNDVWYALLPVFKPKVENKISLIMSGPLSRVITYLQSTYPVASDVLVNVAYYENDNYPYRKWISIPKGETESEVFLISYNQDTYESVGTMIQDITSISPTEDDTYIYTF